VPEKRALSNAVEKWKEDNQLSSTEINDLVQERMPVGKPNRAEQVTVLRFWDTVLGACSGRQRDTAIKYCRSVFHNFGSLGGNFTEQEDEEISHLVATHGKQWSMFSSMLDRPAVAIRKRYENYIICGGKMKMGPWSAEESNLLMELVREAARENGPEERINFVQISKQMGGRRSRLQCAQKWKKLQSS
jgi:hypothetical protein